MGYNASAMHELSVTENILNIALTHAEKSSASRVTDIFLVIGQLSSIVDDSVQFYWDFVSENTICSGAKLHFQRKPARFLCSSCNNEFQIKDELTSCPSCGGMQITITSGEEFYVDSIEIEKKVGKEQ